MLTCKCMIQVNEMNNLARKSNCVISTQSQLNYRLFHTNVINVSVYDACICVWAVQTPQGMVWLMLSVDCVAFNLFKIIFLQHLILMSQTNSIFVNSYFSAASSMCYRPNAYVDIVTHHYRTSSEPEEGRFPIWTIQMLYHDTP